MRDEETIVQGKRERQAVCLRELEAVGVAVESHWSVVRTVYWQRHKCL